MRINIEINDWDDLKQLYASLTEHFVQQAPEVTVGITEVKGGDPQTIKQAIEAEMVSNKPLSKPDPEPEPELEEKPKAKPKRKRRTKAEMAAAKAAKEAEKAAEPEPEPEAEPEPEPEAEPEPDDNGSLTLERMRQEFRTFAQAHGETVAFEVIRAYKGVGLAELDKIDYEPLLLQLRMRQEELEKSGE
jgi:hypothetical protein